MKKVQPIAKAAANMFPGVEDVHRVDAMNVEHAHGSCGGGVLLSLEIEYFQESHSGINLVMSPPAAIQISRALRNAVKGYLRDSPEAENPDT